MKSPPLGKVLRNVVPTLLFGVWCSVVFAAGDALPQRGISAHRGENGVFPENTVDGLREAVRLGAAQVEFDVRRTGDGRLIVMHDRTVDRTTDGTGEVAGLTFDSIRSLDAGIKRGTRFAGTKVPTLEEALDCLPRDVWINIHVYAANPEDIAKIVLEKNREHQAFLSCNREQMLAVRKVCPKILICNMQRRRDDPSRYVRETIAWRCDFIQLLAPVSDEAIKALKDAGVRINYFRAQNAAHFRQLVEQGVDFPLVNDCSKFLAVAEELGLMRDTRARNAAE